MIAGEVIPLSDLAAGEIGVVQSLAGEERSPPGRSLHHRMSPLRAGRWGRGAHQRRRGFVSRLAALGFTPGTEVKMIQNFGHGPIIVLIRDTHIALGRGEAMKVLVRRLV